MPRRVLGVASSLTALGELSSMKRSTSSTTRSAKPKAQKSPPVSSSGAGAINNDAKAARDFLPGEGEMGRLIRDTDWSRTAIGPREAWSPALRMMVNFMLANRFPLLLWWGPEYVSIYNDAYIPVLGTKHPWALGQPVSVCWSEIWSILKPLIDTPFSGGPATWNEDIFLEINRYGFVEETHFTIAYSPVPDESVASGIGGVLATVHEITGKIVGERRVLALRNLGARVADAKSSGDACAVAADTLAKHPKDVPFALFYLIDPDGKKARLAAASGVDLGTRFSPLEIGLNEQNSNQGWPLAEALRAEALLEVGDLGERFGKAVPSGPWSDPPREAVVIPIPSNIPHQFAGALVLGVSPRLKFDVLYRSFFDLVTTQIATAIANARAYEEERKRAQALAEIDRAKTAFFSNVSHEFRTPLTLMLGPAEEALADSSTTPANRQRLEVIQRNAERLQKLVNGLLDFSRIEAGRLQATYEKTDLPLFTAELASVFRAMVEKAGLKLTVDCPHIDESVYVDPAMWEKIVFNLLSNAFKFTFGGEISVTLRQQKDHVTLTVRDTGVGIPAGELPRIFERFHRVEGARGRAFEGSGIGLAMVQEFARLHGGDISVESTVERGSTFSVRIPLGKAHLPADRIRSAATLISGALRHNEYVEEAMRWLPQGASSGSPAPQVETSRARILVADDNADMREYVQRLLSPHYEVTAVNDGLAALEAANTQSFDLILADVMMPHLDGFGLVRSLRHPGSMNYTTPIILLSARAGDEARVEGIEKGADDYLIKPFIARELLARVATHIDLARIRKQAIQDLRQSEERKAFLLKLSDALRPLADPLEIQAAASRLLGEQLKANRAFYFEVERDGSELIIERDYFAGVPSIAGQFAMSQFDSPAAQELLRGRTVISEDANADGQVSPKQMTTLRAIQIRAWVGVPIVKGGRLIAGLGVSESEPRTWTPSEMELIEEVADRVWTTVERARAQAALRASEERFRALTTTSWEVVYRMSPDWKVMFHLDGKEFIADTHAPSSSWLDEYIFAEDEPVVSAAIRKSIQGKTPFDLEHRVRRADGSAGWTHSRAVPILDSAGEITEWFGSASDITERKQVEQELRRKEQETQRARNYAEATLRTSPVPLLVLESDLRVRSGNDAFYKTFKVEPSETEGRLVYELGNGQWNIPRLRELLEKILPKHTLFTNFEVTHDFETIGRRTMLLNARRMQNEEGYPERIVLVIENITDRKLAEEALRESSERAELAAEASQIGYWFCDLPFDKLIWDHRVKEHFWLPSDTEVTIDIFYERLHPDDRERTRQEIEKSIANHSRYDIEYRTVSPDGREKWIRAMGRTFYDAQSKPNRFDGVTLDVTAEKRANAEITRLAALANFAPDLVALANLDGNVIYLNESGRKLLGIDSAFQVREAFLLDFVHEIDRDRFQREVLSRALANGETWSGETLLRDFQTGEPIATEQRAFAIKDNTGAIIQYGTVAHDVRVAKRAEEALRRSEKLAAVGRMAATMAHEVNNPLESVTNLLYLARKDVNMNAQTRHKLQLAGQELHRVAHITNQTLGFYRDSAGPASLDVTQTIRDLLEVYNYRFRNREITVEKDLDAPAKIVTSAGELRQVFSNLFINSVDATPTGGRIRVRVRPARHWNGSRRRGVRITVADTGCGIDPAHRAKIFDAFYTTKQEVGTGLGLWLSHSLVQKRGGQIQVRSRVEPGKNGTVFSVFWPDEIDAASGPAKGNGL